jgi:hypothetical protein
MYYSMFDAKALAFTLYFLIFKPAVVVNKNLLLFFLQELILTLIFQHFQQKIHERKHVLINEQKIICFRTGLT